MKAKFFELHIIMGIFMKVWEKHKSILRRDGRRYEGGEWIVYLYVW
jgi:hypothetical protein